MADALQADVAQIHAQVRNWFGNGVPGAAELLNAAVRLMPLVQRAVRGPGRGAYKKQLLIGVVERMLEQDVTWESDEQKGYVLALSAQVLPAAVDTAAGIATGQIDVGKAAKHAARLWQQCFPCCF